MNPLTLRVMFEKVDRTKYISHLDMFRCIQRGLKRTGLPVWYSLGYNPHIYLNFSLPLSLGFESCCESFDFRLNEEVDCNKVKEQLNAVFPVGLRVTSVKPPVMKPESIAWSDYSVRFLLEQGDGLDVGEKLNHFLNRETIQVIKTTKKAQKELDLKPLFTVLERKIDTHEIYMKWRVASGTTLNINPNLILQELFSSECFEPDCCNIKRIRIMTDTFEDYQ